MNKDRRERIKALGDDILDLRVQISELQDEEQEYHDNMPDAIQSGEKGDAATEAIVALERALDALDEAMNQLDEAAA